MTSHCFFFWSAAETFALPVDWFGQRCHSFTHAHTPSATETYQEDGEKKESVEWSTCFQFLVPCKPCKGLSRTTAYNSRHEMVLLPLEITFVDLGKGRGRPYIHLAGWIVAASHDLNPHPAISMVGMPLCIWDIATWWFGTSQAPRGQQVPVISGCNTLRPWLFCLPTMDLLIKLCGKTVGH